MPLCLIVVRSSPCTGVTAAGGSAFDSHILVVQRHVPLTAPSHIAHPDSAIADQCCYETLERAL